jgi:hypothetical protein
MITKFFNHYFVLAIYRLKEGRHIMKSPQLSWELSLLEQGVLTGLLKAN